MTVNVATHCRVVTIDDFTSRMEKSEILQARHRRKYKSSESLL